MKPDIGCLRMIANTQTIAKARAASLTKINGPVHLAEPEGDKICDRFYLSVCAALKDQVLPPSTE